MSARKAPNRDAVIPRPPQLQKKRPAARPPQQMVVIRLPWLEEYRRHPHADLAHEQPRLHAPCPPPARDCRDGPVEKYWTRAQTPR